MIYGVPLAGILNEDWQSAFTAVGWLGLLIIVFEGAIYCLRYRSVMAEAVFF